MKSEKGVTLISLTIYIIVMTIVIGIVAMLSTYFYKNTHDLTSNVNPLTEYTKFNSFFTEEVNHENIKILECGEHYVVFDNGMQYTYVPGNKAIYQNKVKIASDVENCKFEQKVKNGKDAINVILKFKNAEERNIDYTLKK